jgi:dienelactone hydrolase
MASKSILVGVARARLSTTSAAVALALLLGACSESSEPPRVEAACHPDAHGDALTTEEVLAPGPYAVGRTSYTLVDTSRTTPAHGDQPELPSRTLETAVWYPATTAGSGTPAAEGGPFPLVIYSHGFSSFNQEGKLLNQLLASRGYVIFAPEFPLSSLNTVGGPTITDTANQPADVSFEIDSALAMSAEAGHLLEGKIDADRIAAVGLSLGGLTTLLVTFHEDMRDPRIDVAAALAPPADFFSEAYYDTRVAPLLLEAGTYDEIVDFEANARTAFERANPPVNLYTLVKGTHTAFASYAAAAGNLSNVDEFGCSALSEGELGDGGFPMDGGVAFDLVEALGGAEAGLVPVVEVPDCQGPFLPSMTFARQTVLEKASVSSFLESYFAADPTTRDRACHYHERVLPGESDDVEFDRR